LAARMGYRPLLAVRSSALWEDQTDTSFAGLHRSLLNVDAESLCDAYKEVVASLYSLPAMSYRLNRGLPDAGAVMCVGVLAMAPARSGGVLYTRDPTGSEERVIVNSLWGLPKGIVDGRCAGDMFELSRPLPGEGVKREKTDPDLQNQPSLTEAQAVSLAQLGLRIEEAFGAAQDIEWAMDDAGRIVILQSRPLKLADKEEAEDEALEPVAASQPMLFEQGIAVSTGAAAGPVHLVLKGMDALSFPEGGVLVAPMALARHAALLGRAAAVVAEEGNVAGHLANVCREFRTPALFGVSGATTQLQNGQLVTVDATHRRILDGRDEGLVLASRRHQVVEDTPVRATLRQAAGLITPLRLLDPTAAAFNADNVQTFHDITRFCHEKAVDEMFRFGRDHHFPERSSKQLFYKVPMRWWVLNLDDGFVTDVPGKYVKLENIASEPMLAVWAGVAAYPWGGPPAIDAKGFASIMFRSTTDPNLAAGARSAYADRNYFMISKNYCSLSSRLGYHFSTIEALVGERRGENYASFQFKGGAADFDRRKRRVELIAELLDEYGFTTHVREDNLLARIERLPAKDMLRALKTLGYLIIHTRQIDMVMAKASDAAYYLQKFRGDIATLQEA